MCFYMEKMIIPFLNVIGGSVIVLLVTKKYRRTSNRTTSSCGKYGEYIYRNMKFPQQQVVVKIYYSLKNTPLILSSIIYQCKCITVKQIFVFGAVFYETILVSLGRRVSVQYGLAAVYVCICLVVGTVRHDHR